MLAVAETDKGCSGMRRATRRETGDNGEEENAMAVEHMHKTRGTVCAFMVGIVFRERKFVGSAAGEFQCLLLGIFLLLLLQWNISGRYALAGVGTSDTKRNSWSIGRGL